MVFDLVRGLGAKEGELEVNALFEIPLEDGGGSGVGSDGKTDEGLVFWAPEVEGAMADAWGPRWAKENGRHC